MSESSYSPKLEERFAKIPVLVEQDGELSAEEREFVEDTFKQVLAYKKRELTEFEANYKKERQSQSHQQHAEQLKHFRKNIFYFCVEVINLVDKQLLPKTRSAEGRVFFLKVKGDFFRYSAECFKKGDSYYKSILQEGLKAYMMGYLIGQNELACEDSVFLSLCLNFSVFYYVIVGDAVKSCELISKTIKQLESKKNSIVDEIWKSIQPTMCLLKNNFVLWTSELEDN